VWGGGEPDNPRSFFINYFQKSAIDNLAEKLELEKKFRGHRVLTQNDATSRFTDVGVLLYK